MIRNSLAVAWKDLLIVLKDKGALAVYFLMPLLFASLMGMAFGNTGNQQRSIELPVLMVNQDRGAYGEMLVQGLRDSKVLVVEEISDAALADQRVASGDVPAALVIPADLSSRVDAGEPAVVTIIKDPTQQEAANIVAGITNQAMAEIGMLGELRYGIHAVLSQEPGYDQAPPELRQAVEAQTLGVMWTQVQKMRSSPVIGVQTEAVAGVEEAQPWDPVTYYVPAFTVAFAFFLVGTVASTLLSEKEEGTFRRLLCSPMERAAIIAGKMLAYVIIVFLQVLVVFGTGYALFKMSLGQSPLALVLLTLALSLASASMGMLMGTLCRSSKQADQLGVILGFVLLVLGGSTFPLFRAPGFAGMLSRMTPNAWGIEGYMGLLSDNWSLARTAPNILALLGFAVVFFALAVKRFKFE